MPASFRAFSHSPRIAEKCLAVDPARRNYLIIGDSHAAHYWAGFQEVYPEINFLQATASGCKPTIVGEGSARCRSVMDHAFGTFIPSADLDAVIISAHWSRGDVAGLQKTIEALRAHVPKVIVMGPIVTYDDFVPRLLARAEAQQNPDIVRRARNQSPRAVDSAFQEAFGSSDYVRYVPVIDLLCGASYECETLDAVGLPLQFDRAHLTAGGAAEVARLIRIRGGWFDHEPLTTEPCPAKEGKNSRPNRAPQLPCS